MKIKFLITAIFMTAILACQEETEVINKQTYYTFNVYLEDKTPFKAEIIWGVNKTEFTERVGNTWLYASAFTLANSDQFIIQVNSVDADQFTLEITQNGTNNKKEVVIKANQEYKF